MSAQIQSSMRRTIRRMSVVVKISPALKAHLAWERENGVLDGVAEESRRLYGIWRSMHERCRNPSHVAYPRYGGRGIAVCAEWAAFDAFERWAHVSGYTDHLTFERSDDDLGYSPGNCRWAAAGGQARIKRSNVNIEIDGVVMCATDWADKAGLNVGTVLRRFHLGWRGARLLLPPDKGRRQTCANSVREAGRVVHGVECEAGRLAAPAAHQQAI